MRIDERAVLLGRWEVERYSRLTGRFLGKSEGPNTVLSTGEDAFLDMMFNTNSPAGTDQFTNAQSQLKIYDSGDVLRQTLSTKSGYPAHGAEDSGTVQYWWEDISIDTYEADRVDFLNPTSAVIFSRKDPTSFGSKPNSENWIYKYTLEISNFGDSDIQMDGLDHALRLFTGNRILTSKQWSNTDCYILVENNGASVTYEVGMDDGYPSRTGQTTTCVFTAESGQANQEWYNVAVAAVFTEQGETELSRTQEELGSKSSSMEREYTFTFSF